MHPCSQMQITAQLYLSTSISCVRPACDPSTLGKFGYFVPLCWVKSCCATLFSWPSVTSVARLRPPRSRLMTRRKLRPLKESIKTRDKWIPDRFNQELLQTL